METLGLDQLAVSPEQQLDRSDRETAGAPVEPSRSTRAHAVEVELSFVGRTVLRIRDDGRGLPR